MENDIQSYAQSQQVGYGQLANQPAEPALFGRISTMLDNLSNYTNETCQTLGALQDRLFGPQPSPQPTASGANSAKTSCTAEDILLRLEVLLSVAATAAMRANGLHQRL